MKDRIVVHILIWKPHPDGGVIRLNKTLCDRKATVGYQHKIRNFYPNTCKHCIQAQITTYNRRLPDRDRRRIERRS